MCREILIVNDSPARQWELSEAVHEAVPGSPVRTLSPAETQPQFLDRDAFALVIVCCEAEIGRRLLEPARLLSPGSWRRLIVVADPGSEDLAVAALHARAADYFPALPDRAVLVDSIRRWLTHSAPAPEIEGGEILVGDGVQMQGIRKYISQVAQTDCTVLITGETGSGKELVAQLIHGNSRRKQRPLVCINCAAIPEPLLESELFGYERGAFTGANSSRDGLIAQANGGTVFFDEIGDMSPVAQAKILRVLETKEVHRLGGRRGQVTDIRILAATHRDLDQLAKEEKFRPDLFFRLNVGRIHLPPLRERKADILNLIEYMIREMNEHHGRNIEGIAPGAVECLLKYDWPGNVRQLRNVIEGVFITLSEGVIGAEHLPPYLVPDSVSNADQPDNELASLLSALSACEWNKSKAAERLRWSRMTLYRKMAKYKLSSPGEQKSATAGALYPKHSLSQTA